MRRPQLFCTEQREDRSFVATGGGAALLVQCSTVFDQRSFAPN
jgi:hypothetical protein